jgi:hypothetical protein
MKNITFTNTCKTQAWASDKDKKFRAQANEYIASVIENSPFLKDETDISIEYYQEGISSIVAQIFLQKGKKLVLKTNSRSGGLLSEIITLRRWADRGISVPTIYEQGEFDSYPYYIMDYFESYTLGDAMEDGSKTTEEVGIVIGTFLFKTEAITGNGFGRPFVEKDQQLIGPTTSLSDYLYKEFLDQKKLKIIEDESPNTSWSMLLNEHIESLLKTEIDNKSILGNLDLSPRHFFATNTPVMFDPFPELVPKYFDIAFYLLPELGTYTGGNYVRRKATIDAYVALGGTIDCKIIRSAIWLLTYRKCGNLLEQTDEARTKRAHHMLSVIAHDNSFNEYLRLYSLL